MAERLPEIAVVRDRSRALAVLDAILCPDPDFRYYSYTATWADGEELATMADGSGNDYAIVFSPAGVYAQGFDHESPLSPYRDPDSREVWPGLLDGLPAVFVHNLEEPAFWDEEDTPRITACFWRETSDSAWRTGNPEPLPPGEVADDSASWLFGILTEGPEAFQEWAEDYYETTVDIEAVRHVCALRPLTEAVVAQLNPEASLADLAETLTSIGYPASE